MLLPHGTVIAVIDAHTFNLFRNAGTEAEPELVETESPKLDSHNHSGGTHHDGSTAVKTEEAHTIAAIKWLNTEVLAHNIEHLVLIAGPRTIGELRKHYHKALETALVGEVHKDLGKSKAQDILAALKAK